MTPFAYAEQMTDGAITPEMLALAERRLRDQPPPASEHEMQAFNLRISIRSGERGLVDLDHLAADRRTSPEIVADIPRVRENCERELLALRDALTALLGARARRAA